MDRKPEVLAFLKGQGEASLGEVAEHLGVTKQGALRHLEALRTAGLVTLTPTEHHGPGRPEHRYELTAAAAELFPHGHRELAAELIDFMTPDQLERFFTARAARLEAEYANRLSGLDFDQKVRELGRLATEHGHMSEVERTGSRRGGTLRLRHCNCPIQDVAARTAFPCQHEMEMYQRLLGASVTRSAWLRKGDTTCTYEITRNTSTTKRRGNVNG